LKRHLVVADLHIGVEKELRDRGVRVPRQLPRMEARVTALIEATSPRGLVVLGDLKHNIPGISRDEYRDIPPFIEALREMVEVTLVKGNHDGDIERLLPGVEVVKTLELGGHLLAHGHLRLDGLDYRGIIIAHNHPCVSFRDELGGVSRESAWLRARLKPPVLEELGLKGGPEIVVMPAFNEILPETAVNAGTALLGPLFRAGMVDVENAEVVLLDGTHLGRVKDLR